MSDIADSIAFLRTRAAKLRAGAIEGINPDKLPKLAAFIRDNPNGVTINSAYRSPQHQAEILRNHLSEKNPELVARWDEALAQNGGDVVAAGAAARPWLREAGVTKWVAPPGSSNHQKGAATDLGYANDEAKKWALANASKYGLAFPMPHEPWHVELAGARANAGDPAKGFGGLPAQPGVSATSTPMAMPDLSAPQSAPEAVAPATDIPVTGGFDLSKAIAALAGPLQPQASQMAQKPAMPAIRQVTRPVQVAERSGEAPKKASLSAIFGV